MNIEETPFYNTDEFRIRLAENQITLADYVTFMLRDNYSDILNYDEIDYISEKVAEGLGDHLIQVIRKGVPE